MAASPRGGRWFGLLLTIAFGATTALAAPPTEEVPRAPALLPDAAQAQVGGRTAVGFWASRDGQALDAEGYTVHLVDDNRLEEELTLPAGHWLVPPGGVYKVWVEGKGSITSSFSVLRFSGGPFRGRGIAAVNEVVEAGRVELPAGLELRPHESVRVLRIGDPEAAGSDRGFMRALTAKGARGVLIPAGRAVALLYDTRKGQYLAASQPFEVPAQRTAVVPTLSQPRDSVVFAIVRRSQPGGAIDDLELTLADTADAAGAPGAARPADVLIPTWEWIYALWYGVRGPRVALEGASATGVLPPDTVDLAPGAVTTVRRQMQPPLKFQSSTGS